MCVVIRNLGGDEFGVCEYEVRINQKRITVFKHDRMMGLAKCLEAASKAVLQQQWVDVHDALVRSQETSTFDGEF